jgi:hypothetical protein
MMKIKNKCLTGKVLAAGALLLYLLLTLMAALPALHEIFHNDSHAPAHHCAVTLLTSSQVDASGHDSIVFSPQFTFASHLKELASGPAKTADRFPPGRAPPQFSVH